MKNNSPKQFFVRDMPSNRVFVQMLLSVGVGKGRTIRKLMEGEGGGGAKYKKKISAREN